MALAMQCTTSYVKTVTISREVNLPEAVWLPCSLPEVSCLDEEETDDTSAVDECALKRFSVSVLAGTDFTELLRAGLWVSASDGFSEAAWLFPGVVWFELGTTSCVTRVGTTFSEIVCNLWLVGNPEVFCVVISSGEAFPLSAGTGFGDWISIRLIMSVTLGCVEYVMGTSFWV